MALPIVLNTPKYELTLPLSKKTISYRPYLVKEEKLLMMAMESGDQKMILKTVQDIIDACTFGEIKSKSLPTAELELIFLKLRAKSVGERSTVGYKCKSCTTVNEISINLNDTDIEQDKIVSNKIMLTDTVGIMMKYPTSEDVARVISSDGSQVNNTFAIIGACIDTIFDAENVYPTSESSKKDIEDFVDSLNASQFSKIKDFFESMPKLKKDVSFDCSSCGAHNDITLEGLQNFFA